MSEYWSCFKKENCVVYSHHHQAVLVLVRLPVSVWSEMFLVLRLSSRYPRTTGASYSTTVPHSQSHAARCSPHMAPSSEPFLAHRSIHHGVPPWGEVGSSGWSHPIYRDRVHRSRPCSGQSSAHFYMKVQPCDLWQQQIFSVVFFAGRIPGMSFEWWLSWSTWSVRAVT